MSAIPLADMPRLARLVRRTLAVEVAVVVVVVALIIAFALAARRTNATTVVSLPSGSSAIVVLDLSASISSDTFSRIGNTLAQLAATRGGRYGLIVFSDQAYEALPPGTPAADLQPLVRYFTLPRQHAPGFQPQFPPNPWSTTFTAGTNISAGMALARQVALADVKRPVVILISDLNDDPGDVPRLAGILGQYRQNAIPVRIVGLNPAPADETLFRRLLGPSAPIAQSSLPTGTPGVRSTVPFPWLLAALGLAVACALAAHEVWGPPLVWRWSA
jgi:hypothetical protein